MLCYTLLPEIVFMFVLFTEIVFMFVLFTEIVTASEKNAREKRNFVACRPYSALTVVGVIYICRL